MTVPTVVRRFRVETFEAALKRPFVTALGRKSATTNVGLTLELACGARGYGEASSSLAFARLSPRRLASALARAAAGARGRDARDWTPLCEQAWSAAGAALPAAAAFEAALLSALAAWRGMPLAEWFGAASREGETDVTISAADATAAARAAAEARDEGFRSLKVKVGTSPKADLERVLAVRRAHPRAHLLLDGNQGLTVSSALKLLEGCAKAGIAPQLLEQPLPKHALAQMAALTKRCPVPVAADESVADPQGTLKALELGAASAINVKMAKSGLTRSLAIVQIARAAKVPLMMGCMAETAAGLSASVHFALGTGAFRWLDLDSDHLLASGTRPGTFRRDGPRILL